jgi:hypothetical protein
VYKLFYFTPDLFIRSFSASTGAGNGVAFMFRKQELIKLQKALVTDEAIGKKFGVTRPAVRQIPALPD